MKKKLLNSMRVLLVAAGLCVGASAWAATATELYDFTLSEHQGNFTYGDRCPDYYSGTWGYYVTNAWLNNRFTFADGTDNSAHRNYWQVRTFKTNDKNCTGLNYTQSTKRPFGIQNLKNGDVIILNNTSAATVKLQALSANLKKEGESSVLAAEAELDYGQRYVVSTESATTTVEIYGVQYCCVTSIQIITSDTETIEAPTFKVAAAGNNRTVTIIDGATNSFGSPVNTYYTTNGDEPTTSSTKYTAPFTITESCTVKAISVAVGGTQSTEGHQTVEAGTPVALIAPVVTLTKAVANGLYYAPQYTIVNGDNSGVLGSPTPVLSATLNGTPVDISAGTFTATDKGTLVVTASSDGYTSAATNVDIATAVYSCLSTPNFNEIPLAELGTVLGGTWTDDGTDRWSYWSKTAGKNADLTSNGGETYAQYKLTSGGDVTVGEWFKFSPNRGSSNLSVLAGYGLGEKGYTPTMTINNPVENAIVEYAFGYDAPSVKYVVMTAEDEAAGKWNPSLATAQVLKYCKYYVPVTSVSATIGTTGWTTFASEYPLDLSGMTASTGDVTAYYASAVGGSSVTMTSTEAAIIGGEGIMLKGTPTATITIPVAATGAAIEGNKLVGRTTDLTVSSETENYANFYVLSNNGGKAEFQNLKNYIDAGNSVTINAGKAYLDATGASGARLNIVFDDEATGINAVDNSLQITGKYYNLSGQRVMVPTRGLYIVNGKKIIIK